MRTLTLMLALLASAPATAEDARIARWIEDLRDDDVRWNAREARGELYRSGAAAIPALERALDSDDWQQRHLAAHVLALFAIDDGAVYEPSPRCAEVLIEGLSHDRLPRYELDDGGDGSYIRVYNAATATRLFARRPRVVRRMRREFEHVVDNGDPQGAFLAAYLLGLSGVEASIPKAAPLLVEHLKDNDIRCDATWAAAALYRFGPRVIPYLAESKLADEQQRETAALIRKNLLDPPRSPADLRRRGIDLSCRHHDPTVEYRHGDPEMLYWDLIERR